MGLRDRLRRLRRANEGEQIVVTLKDSTIARFSKEEVFEEALRVESRRWRAGYRGASIPPPHPVVEALRRARAGEIRRLSTQYGHLISQMVGEDAVLRGERQRDQERN
jgi:hypothetical protein